MWDFEGAWKALLRKRPPGLPAQLELKTLRASSRLWSFVRYSLIPGLAGAGIIAFVIAIDAIRRVAGTAPEGHSAANVVTSPEFLYHFGIEIGVAFFIAGLVSFFIEASARNEQTHLLEESIRLMGSEVIQGVYRIRHDPTYVRTVIASCLAVRHIRSNYEVDCVISEFTEAERRNWGITSSTLVKVEAEITYWSENISNRIGEFAGRYFIPERNTGSKRFARLTYLEVGDEKYVTEEVLAGLELKQDHPEFLESDRGYAFPIPARPRVPTKVHIRAEFAKERSDNEIFTFLRATIGAKIKFRFNVGGLTIGVKARTATDMVGTAEIIPGRQVYWEVPGGALLPNNHVTVWWRSGEAATGEPEALSDLGEAPSLVAPSGQAGALAAVPGAGGEPSVAHTGLRGWSKRIKAATRAATRKG